MITVFTSDEIMGLAHCHSSGTRPLANAARPSTTSGQAIVATGPLEISAASEMGAGQNLPPSHAVMASPFLHSRCMAITPPTSPAFFSHCVGFLQPAKATVHNKTSMRYRIVKPPWLELGALHVAARVDHGFIFHSVMGSLALKQTLPPAAIVNGAVLLAVFE